MDYTVTYIDNPRALSLNSVAELLNNPNNVIWRPAGELLTGLPSSCVDGREKEPAIGTAGGDLGGLIAGALVTAQHVMRREITAWESNQVLGWYLQTYGSAYMHTDEHAMEHVLQVAKETEIVGEDFTIQQLTEYIRSADPDPKRGHDLRAIVTDFDAVGCGHMALMLKHTEAYNTVGSVLRPLMRSFYARLWAGDRRCLFRVLSGEHTEGAVVNIFVNGEDYKITPESQIPLVRPSAGGVSMFVNHPQVISWQERRVLNDLYQSGAIKGMESHPLAEYQEHLDFLINDGTRETISRLATGLPSYNILFKK